MKKLNYTKGEWWLPHFVTNKDNPNGCQCAFVLNEGICGSIADIRIDNRRSISEGGNDSPPLDEAIANAKLICSAPEMYELLISIKQSLENLKNELETNSCDLMIDKVDGLLKKIED